MDEVHVAALTSGALSLGLMWAAFWFGFRHGIDWDHIAAITDITSSQEDRRDSLVLGTLYALGHALVVFVLGILAIFAGDRLPAGVDEAMGKVVGVTLLLLGVYVVFSLVRHGRDFRLRSRWMLVFAGVRRGVRWARERVRVGAEGGRGGGDGRYGPDPATSQPLMGEVVAPDWHHGHHGRPGHHHHRRPEPDDTFLNYSRRTAVGVGMIHGIGAETPTQVLIFLAAAGSGGVVAGLLVLVAFLVGLVASNSIITIGSAYGYLRASGNFALYATVAVLTAVFSLVLGTIFVLGKESFLPAFFGR
jgi:high-affinity nickel-transport protein